MPADITGTEILEEERRAPPAAFVKGPIFAQIILADEINRTPPKTQAALLEAMQEYHVTAAGRTYELERPFFVLATQNPDRARRDVSAARSAARSVHVQRRHDLLPEDDEVRVVTRDHRNGAAEPARVLDGAAIDGFQASVRRCWSRMKSRATRSASCDCSRPGPRRRTSISSRSGSSGVRVCARRSALILGSKARALMHGRHHVSVKDVQALAKPILRHRVIPNFYAEAEGINSDRIVEQLLETVPRAGQRALAPIDGRMAGTARYLDPETSRASARSISRRGRSSKAF